jgi:hypothetical protein
MLAWRERAKEREKERERETRLLVQVLKRVFLSASYDSLKTRVSEW